MKKDNIKATMCVDMYIYNYITISTCTLFITSKNSINVFNSLNSISPKPVEKFVGFPLTKKSSLT